MARLNPVAMDTQNYYGSGYNASNGYNNRLFFYDAAAIKAATSERIFGQFASTRTMPQGHGKEYRVKVEHYSYERMPWAVNTTGPVDAKTLALSKEFKEKGYVSARSLSSVESAIYGDLAQYPSPTSNPDIDKTWVKGTTHNIETHLSQQAALTSEGTLLDGTTAVSSDTGKRLWEGQGAANKVTVVNTTINTFIHRFGEMIDYTEDVLLFSEDNMQVRYHTELGRRQRDIVEDLDQLSLLSTPNQMFAGYVLSKGDLANGITSGTNDERWKINYDLLQKVVKTLSRYRVPKKTNMVTGSLKTDTKTIPPCYVAICGDDVKIDIQNMVKSGGNNLEDFAFVGVEQYADADKSTFAGEFGKVGEVRFVCAEKMMVEYAAGGSVGAGYDGRLSYSKDENNDDKFDVFPILFIGGDSFANIKLQGKGVAEFFSHPPKATEQDPYAMKGFFSYKFWYGSIILRPERVLRLNVCASA